MKRSTSALWRSSASTNEPQRASLFFTQGKNSRKSRPSSLCSSRFQPQRSLVIRAASINSVYFSRCLPSSSQTRHYANATSAMEEVNAIKETISPKFFERRIKELWTGAQQNVEEQAWAKAEDRIFTVLDNVEQLKAALKDFEQDLSKSTYAHDDFIGRAHVLLAFSQHNQGKRDYAEEHYTTGVKLLKSSLGSEHQEVAYALINLSEVLSLLSQLEEAEAKVREALQILEKTHGTDHELYGGALANLGGFLCAQGKLTEAIETNERAVEVLDKALGADNEFTLTTLSNCVKMYEELGNKEGVKKLKERYGERHKEFIEMHKRNDSYTPQEVNEIAKEWDAEGAKRAFDPDGLYKDKNVHKSQLKAFIRAWVDKTGKPLSDEEYAVLVKELEGLSDKELEEASKVAPEKLIAAARSFRSQEPDADDEEYHQVHARLENFEKPLAQRQQQEEEERAEEGVTPDEFNYDEKVPTTEKPARGYWRRFRQEGQRRKAKWAPNNKRPGFLDDEAIEQFQQEAHEKAKKIDQEVEKTIPPATAQLLHMMDKEEELTQRRREREEDKATRN